MLSCTWNEDQDVKIKPVVQKEHCDRVSLHKKISFP